MRYEVITSEGRVVEVPEQVWLQFPRESRRWVSEASDLPPLTGLWPGRVIEVFGERYRVLLVSMHRVTLEPAPGEDSSL